MKPLPHFVGRSRSVSGVKAGQLSRCLHLNAIKSSRPIQQKPKLGWIEGTRFCCTAYMSVRFKLSKSGLAAPCLAPLPIAVRLPSLLVAGRLRACQPLAWQPYHLDTSSPIAPASCDERKYRRVLPALWLSRHWMICSGLCLLFNTSSHSHGLHFLLLACLLVLLPQLFHLLLLCQSLLLLFPHLFHVPHIPRMPSLQSQSSTIRALSTRVRTTRQLDCTVRSWSSLSLPSC